MSKERNYLITTINNILISQTDHCDNRIQYIIVLSFSVRLSDSLGKRAYIIHNNVVTMQVQQPLIINNRPFSKMAAENSNTLE